MTVTTFLNYKEYQADGSSTRFCIPFLLLDRNDLVVKIDSQEIVSGYTVIGLGNPYGEIVFDKAPVGILLLQRNISLLRETDYQENGDLLAETLNRDFDRLYLAIQGFSQNISQSLRVTDPDGISALVLAKDRANKLLSFDSFGQPELIEASTGTATELAQQLRNSSSQNKGSGLVGYNDVLEYPVATIGNGLNKLTARFDNFEGNSVPLFSVFWWSSRESIPAGYITADGQELSQVVFPEANTAIKQGKVPLVDELEWKSNPTKRGCYVANSSSGMFRVPDYNGKYADSLGPLSLSGDSGTIPPGTIQKASDNNTISIYGCWIIKLFTSVINSSTANIQQLVTENASLVARMSLLESYQQAKRFTIIYPNGGTEENPAMVTNNKYYEMDNPFPGCHVICIAELFIDGNWGDVGWIYSTSWGSYGVKASILNIDKIIIRTGTARIVAYPYDSGSAHINTASILTSAPCRVKVWRII